MADFCWQCTEDILGLDGEQNDCVTPALLAGEVCGVLCEGCGEIWVDRHGWCQGGPGCTRNHFPRAPDGCLTVGEMAAVEGSWEEPDDHMPGR